jgi:hypothetical protein
LQSLGRLQKFSDTKSTALKRLPCHIVLSVS